MRTLPLLVIAMFVLGCSPEPDPTEGVNVHGYPHTDTDTDAVETDTDGDTDGVVDTATTHAETDSDGRTDTDPLVIDDTDPGTWPDTDTDASGDTDTTGSGDTDTDALGDTDTTSGTDTDTDTTVGSDTDTTVGSDTDTTGGTDTDTTGGSDTDNPPWDTDTDPPWDDSGYWWDTDMYQPSNWSCDPADLPLRWPMGGVEGADWTVHRYVDHGAGPTVTDYTGATGMFAKTTDAFTATDIDVPNFRWMDDGLAVLAAGPGVVIDVTNGNYDRNLTCTGDWNAVHIRHVNGYITTYGHLKNRSLRVRRGDLVAAGDVLGVVGSSGCSTHPHLHFEVRDCASGIVDPFEQGMWTRPPTYNPPLTYMDVSVQGREIIDLPFVQDPGPDATLIEGNTMTGFGLTMSGGRPGDRFGITIRRPDGVVFDTTNVTLSTWQTIHHWWWNRRIGDWRGTWTLEVLRNGTVVDERTFEVEAQASAFAVPEADLADVLDSHLALDLTPVWLDVYAVSGQRYYNLLSEPTDHTAEVWWGVDLATHEANIADAIARGLRPAHVDMNDDGAHVTYVGIVTDEPAVWDAYDDVDATTHFNTYYDHQLHGLRPVAVVQRDDRATGNPEFSAIYDDVDVGSFLMLTDIPRADFFNMNQSQRSVGRYLSHFDVRNVGTDAYLTGVWDSRNRAAWGLATVMTISDLETKHEDERMDGMRLRAISGYERFGQHRFVGFWTER